MRFTLSQILHDEDGLLSFEWTLLVTLLTIGIVSGASAARDAIIDELGDTAEDMLAIDQSYTISFPQVQAVHGDDAATSSRSSFVDFAVFTDCQRYSDPVGVTFQQQALSDDFDGGG